MVQHVCVSGVYKCVWCLCVHVCVQFGGCDVCDMYMSVSVLYVCGCVCMCVCVCECVLLLRCSCNFFLYIDDEHD